jgi:hypothetical protein
MVNASLSDPERINEVNTATVYFYFTQCVFTHRRFWELGGYLPVPSLPNTRRKEPIRQVVDARVYSTPMKAFLIPNELFPQS